MDWETLSVTLFVYVSMLYDTRLRIYCQRFGNNNQPDFTDEEVITIYLFGIIRKHSEIRDIYNHTRDHLSEWFPKLPSYVAFVQRLNRPGSLFPALSEHISDGFGSNDLMRHIRQTASFPIIMANAKRSSHAEVANGFADKGYCASEGMWYYGVKVHILGIGRRDTLPLPEYIGVTPAGVHDLTAFRQIAPHLGECEIYADKAYDIDESEQELLKKQNVRVHIPVRKKKGQKNPGLSDRLFSTGVSRVRQPIESLFNRLPEKTGIQRGSKIRSYNGLMVHIFGRISAALFIMVFNS